jgi:hypothetical protein
MVGFDGKAGKQDFVRVAILSPGEEMMRRDDFLSKGMLRAKVCGECVDPTHNSVRCQGEWIGGIGTKFRNSHPRIVAHQKKSVDTAREGERNLADHYDGIQNNLRSVGSSARDNLQEARADDPSWSQELHERQGAAVVNNFAEEEEDVLLPVWLSLMLGTRYCRSQRKWASPQPKFSDTRGGP